MTGYVYRGTKPEGLPGLETVNAAIMAARPAGAQEPDLDWLDGRFMPRQPRDPVKAAAGREGGQAPRTRRKETAA